MYSCMYFYISPCLCIYSYVCVFVYSYRHFSFSIVPTTFQHKVTPSHGSIIPICDFSLLLPLHSIHSCTLCCQDVRNVRTWCACLSDILHTAVLYSARLTNKLHQISSHCALHICIIWEAPFKSIQQVRFSSETAYSPRILCFVPHDYITRCTIDWEIWDYLETNCWTTQDFCSFQGSPAAPFIMTSVEAKRNGHNDYNLLDQLWHLVLSLALPLSNSLTHAVKTERERWQRCKECFMPGILSFFARLAFGKIKSVDT